MKPQILQELDSIKEKVDVDLENVQSELGSHLADYMPHQFMDNGKNYRWGFRTLNGQPQFIYEEVI